MQVVADGRHTAQIPHDVAERTVSDDSSHLCSACLGVALLDCGRDELPVPPPSVSALPPPPFLTPPPKISGAGVKGRHQKCSVIGIRLWEEEEEELDAASTAFPSTESTYKGKGNSARWVLISVRIHTTSGVGRAWRRAGEWAGQGRAGQPAGSGTREELQRAPWGQPLMR